MAMKPNGKSPVSSASDEKDMFFRDVSLGPHETQLRFRLIHLWEAWNPVNKALTGLEMLLIDEQAPKFHRSHGVMSDYDSQLLNFADRYSAMIAYLGMDMAYLKENKLNKQQKRKIEFVSIVIDFIDDDGPSPQEYGEGESS